MDRRRRSRSRSSGKPATTGATSCRVAEAHDLVRSVIGMLDRGEVRVAEVVDDEVVVNEWVKHAILMWFRVQEMQIIEAGPVRVRRQAPAEARLRGRRRAGRARRVGALRRVPRAAAS